MRRRRTLRSGATVDVGAYFEQLDAISEYEIRVQWFRKRPFFDESLPRIVEWRLKTMFDEIQAFIWWFSGKKLNLFDKIQPSKRNYLERAY